MAELWKDGFDHYGTGTDGRTRMLQGPWAELATGGIGGVTPVVPSFGARTGTHCLEVGCVSRLYARRVLPASKSTVIVSIGFYLPEIPESDTGPVVCSFMTSGANCAGTLFVRSDGGIVLRGPATGLTSFDSASVLGETAGPVLQAGTWHHIEASFTADAATGACEVRVDEVAVLTLSGLNTGGTQMNQLLFGCPANSTGTPSNVYYDDIIVRDTSGSLNNGFGGDLRVATLFPIANAAAQGWTPRPYTNLGAGVLDNRSADDDGAVSTPDNAALELGASDYTIEMFVRWFSTPTGTGQMVLISKYNTTGNLRSWKLYLKGPSDGDELTFDVSTDGTAGTLTTVHAFPWQPELNRWYHVAVCKDSGTSRMFIDGIQYGTDQADALTPFNGTASLAVGGQMTSTTAVFDGLSADAMFDCVRVTVGVARYTANFTPPSAPLPDNVGDDPDYASNAFVLNFDSEPTVVDDGPNTLTFTLRNSVSILLPEDDEAYETINNPTPDDNTYVEAALVAATGTLTMPTNPTAAQEVVLGSVTYTYVGALTGANDILIGADNQESLDNLRAAVNAEAGEGSTYGTGTVINPDISATALVAGQLLMTARTPGAAGNSLATTTTVTDATFTDTTLDGGADIPGVSEFVIGLLPPEVTGVRSVSVVTRSFKTDSGSSQLQASFVTEAGNADAGASNPLTVNPTYREDVFETDPDTAGAITPSTLVGAKVRLDRTV